MKSVHMMVFTDAERLKFALLAEGLTISSAARKRLLEANSGRPLTPADYASTSGVILWLDDDVWINAPITDYNPNFVHQSPYVLDDDDQLFVRGCGLEAKARFWLPPSYHGLAGLNGEPYNHYAVTHGDRARVSPLRGCGMVCKFCNIPYEDRYGVKPIQAITEAIKISLSDQVQPAHHLLVSGGTPRSDHIEHLAAVYETILTGFPGLEIDIMMVPVDGLFDLTRLAGLGLHQLSINIELFNGEYAARVMKQKYGRGLEWYLRFLESAAETLGPGRVRSMLLVGLESMEDTLAGVSAIVERGCIPVLSPFRPSPSTPLKDVPPPTAEELEEVYCRAHEIATAAGSFLGPDCPPCSHNTLTLMSGLPDYVYRHPVPYTI